MPRSPLLIRTLSLDTDTDNHQQVTEEADIRAIDNAGIAEHLRIEVVGSAGGSARHDETDKD